MPEGIFDERFRGERVPTWEEALDLVQGKVGLNVHLKEGGDPDGAYERRVAEALDGFGMVEDSILTCRDESVGIFAGIDPRIECRIFRASRTPEEYIRKSVEMGLRTMQPGRDITTRDFVRKAHEAGRIVHVFYADTPEDIAFIEIGVDGRILVVMRTTTRHGRHRDLPRPRSAGAPSMNGSYRKPSSR